jgi:NAD(P)-dependent dehydrogenase (short-subunit alcohol dehydrogenase family)
MTAADTVTFQAAGWYAGKNVVVAGGGGSGMGAAAARLVRQAGAEVTVLDLREPQSPDGVTFRQVDLSDPEAIDQAVAVLGNRVDALFNCQGIAGSREGTSAADVMRVNFLGVRHLSERVLPLIPAGGAVASVASVGGLGWERRREAIDELLAAEDFGAGLDWVHAHSGDLLRPAFPRTYSFSKQALIVWTMRRAVTAIEQGVRVNCSSPGSTRTAMAVDFPEEGVRYISRPIGRESTPAEQAWPLLFLNSPAASYVNGTNLVVDGGNAAARTLGLLS